MFPAGVNDLVSSCRLRVDVVICLSTTVRNDTLQEAKEQRVSVKCRKQLRVEEVEMVRSAARRTRPPPVAAPPFFCLMWKFPQSCLCSFGERWQHRDRKSNHNKMTIS